MYLYLVGDFVGGQHIRNHYIKEIKVNADDTATPTYSSELFSVTKADGTTVLGQQQGEIITVPNAGLNNQDWIGTITKVCSQIPRLGTFSDFCISVIF